MRSGCCYSKKVYVLESGTICTNHKCRNYLGNTTAKEAVFKPLKKCLFGLTFICFLLYSPVNYSRSTTPLAPVNVQKPAEVVVAVPAKPLTIENVKEEIESLGMVCPEVVLAQAKLESGNLTSRVLRRANNMFGMRYPGKRQTTASGIYIPQLDTVVKGTRAELRKYSHYSSYAAYDTWQDAIKDYKLWQENVFRINDKYLDFLQKYYAEDTLYLKRVKHIADRH